MCENWIWLPNVGIGPLRFGMSIDECRDIHKNMVMQEDDTSNCWITYSIPDENIFIDFEQAMLVCVRSHSSFIYNNRNLVGITLEALIDCLGVSPDEDSSDSECIEYDDGEVQTPYDFCSLGLHIYCSNNVVVSATCLTYET